VPRCYLFNYASFILQISKAEAQVRRPATVGEPLGLSQAEAANNEGIACKTLSMLLNEHQGINKGFFNYYLKK